MAIEYYSPVDINNNLTVGGAVDITDTTTFAGDVIISRTDPTITLFDSSGPNTDPNGRIVFKELSNVENFDINYNGASDRLEFRGRISNTDNTDLVYITRSTTTPLTVLGGATFSGDIAVGGTVLGTSAKFGRDADNLIDFTTDNQMTFRIGNVNQLVLNQSRLAPSVNDASVLGSSSLGWSDLFLASGAVINFNNGDVTLTHSSNQLAVSGGNLLFNFAGNNYNTADGTAFLDSEDNELVTFSEAVVNFPSTVTVAADIVHTGDTDTKISFGTDTITFTCGNTAIYTLGSSSATMAGILDITNTTDSSDATGDTGALRCEGGASIAKKLFVGSAITSSNDVIAFSDRKLKDNIETLDGKKVLDMRGVSFTRKDTGKESSGVIAQEIQEVAPELVHDTNGTLGVAYGNLVGYLIEAIKDQQKQIDELRKNCNGCSK